MVRPLDLPRPRVRLQVLLPVSSCRVLQQLHLARLRVLPRVLLSVNPQLELRLLDLRPCPQVLLPANFRRVLQQLHLAQPRVLLPANFRRVLQQLHLARFRVLLPANFRRLLQLWRLARPQALFPRTVWIPRSTQYPVPAHLKALLGLHQPSQVRPQQIFPLVVFVHMARI